MRPPADPADVICARCSLSAWRRDAYHCRWCNALLPPARRRWCSDECADAYVTAHVWGPARHAAIVRDGWSCRLADQGGCRGVLEVDHVEPRWGAGYGVGCHHHPENLRALCHRHHVDETARWRRTRRAFLHYFRLDIAAA